jgi:hypothetical protein
VANSISDYITETITVEKRFYKSGIATLDNSFLTMEEKARPFGNQNFEEILATSLKKGIPFRDPLFPPTSASIDPKFVFLLIFFKIICKQNTRYQCLSSLQDIAFTFYHKQKRVSLFAKQVMPSFE